MERSCKPGSSGQELTLPIPDANFGSLMFRSGSVGSGSTNFLRADILTATRYTQPLQDLLDSYAKRIADGE